MSIENSEQLLIELEEFNKNTEQDNTIPQNLENLIEHVAKTGTYVFSWNLLRKVFLIKFTNVFGNLSTLSPSVSNAENLNASSSSLFMQSSNTTNETSNKLLKERIMERMKSFTNAPFTIQRISELLLKPNNHYTRADKFLRGLEKCVMVVTTVDPNGNKIFIETNNSMPNGVFLSPSPAPSTPINTEIESTPTKGAIVSEVESLDNDNLTTPKNELQAELMDTATTAPWASRISDNESEPINETTPEPEKTTTDEESIAEEKTAETSIILEETEVKKVELETTLEVEKQEESKREASIDDENSQTPKKKLKTEDEEI